MRKANSGIGGGVNRSGIGRGIGGGTTKPKNEMFLPKSSSEFAATTALANNQ